MGPPIETRSESAGPVVVITGASSGIGAATARVLAKQGYRLVLAARRVDRLEALASELTGGANDAGHIRSNVLVVPADVTRPEALEDLARRTVERFGRIDVWINNAGISHPHPWWTASLEEARRVIDVNLTAPIVGSMAAIREMMRQGGGHIINVVSVSGHIGVTGIYSATKFGLRGLSEAMRRELRPHGIHVSMVTPGFVRTEMTAQHQLPMPPPEVVGKAIASLIRRPRREVVVPGVYRFFMWVNRVAPGLVDRVVAGRLPAHREKGTAAWRLR